MQQITTWPNALFCFAFHSFVCRARLHTALAFEHTPIVAGSAGLSPLAIMASVGRLVASVCAVLLVLASGAFGSGSGLAGSGTRNCLYISSQRRQGVYVYTPFETDRPNVDPSKQVALARTEPFPTGVAVHNGILYVATYGKVPTPPPAIHMYSLADNLDHVGSLRTGEELATCFPEALAAYSSTLFVACGAGGRILMYNLSSRTFTGELAASLNLPAIWGLAVHKGYLYFSSHCTWEQINGQYYCEPAKHDKIYRVPLASLIDAAITEFAIGPQPDEEGHEHKNPDEYHVRTLSLTAHRSIFIYSRGRGGRVVNSGRSLVLFSYGPLACLVAISRDIPPPLSSFTDICLLSLSLFVTDNSLRSLTYSFIAISPLSHTLFHCPSPALSLSLSLAFSFTLL